MPEEYFPNAVTILDSFACSKGYNISHEYLHLQSNEEIQKKRRTKAKRKKSSIRTVMINL